MFFPRKFIDRVAGFFRKIKKNKLKGVGGTRASGVCVFAEATATESFNRITKQKNKMYKKGKTLERVNRILIKNCSPLHGTLNANK